LLNTLLENVCPRIHMPPVKVEHQPDAKDDEYSRVLLKKLGSGPESRPHQGYGN
jgi:hypothetical protein